MTAEHRLRAAVEELLDGAHRAGPITHSADCTDLEERCIAHAVLEVWHVPHVDPVCDVVTRIVRRWLIARQVPVP